MRVLIYSNPLKTVAEWATHFEAEPCQPRRACVNLNRKFPAKFRSHYALDVFDNVRDQTAVVVEIFGAIRNFDSRLFADELVMRAFIDILKTSPAADVKDQDMSEVCKPGLDVLNQLSSPVRFLIMRPLSPSSR
jgi:hypothetical protein